MPNITNLDYCSKTIEIKTNIEKGFLVLGERLHNIREKELWQGGWSNWEEFLMELKVNPSTASRLMSIYRKYVLEYKMDTKLLAQASWSNLYEAIPICTDKEKAIELVESMAIWKPGELKEKIRDTLKGGCNHEWFELHLRQCRECGKREQIEK